MHNFSKAGVFKLTASTTIALAVFALSACGGGGNDATANSTTGNTANAGSNVVTLSGKVTDGPIAGAKVCLLSNGVQANNAAGDAICSSQTDAQGNYVLTIPRSLASGLLTLIAAKGADIKLVSTLGTVEQVLSAAGATGAVAPAQLSSANVTHLTTAGFALADADHDGKVTQAELDAYVPDFSAVQRAATIIQAYIDGGQTSFIGGATTDTLTLASAAVQGKPLGTTGKTADTWFNDPANAEIIRAANQALSTSLATDLAGKFVNYRLTKTVTQQTIPLPYSTNGGTATLYCSSDRTLNTPINIDVSIAFDAARNVALVRYLDDKGQPAYITGSYNAKSGAFNLYELEPKWVSSVQGSVTFYEEGYNKHVGTIDANGVIAGTFEEKWAETWTIDATRQECSNTGPFTITKKQ